LRQSVWTSAAVAVLLLAPTLSFSRDFGLQVPVIHKGKFTSSALYEHLKVSEDFNIRGKADFKSHVVGSQFTYGITDQIAVGIKGGALVEAEQEAQGTTWRGGSGYLYGIDLYNEVFPATQYRPGVMVNAGVSQFRVPLTQKRDAAGTVTLVDQRLSGVDYHAAMLLSMKWSRISPYTGIRIFGRSVDWRDNQSTLTGGPDKIVGHAHGNASIVVGLPVRITPDLQFHVEGMFVNETVITAGLTLATF
jgi:hypothetical protein